MLSYEVQVSREARGAGLGKLLMRCLETLARAYSLSKVMLTVFECKSSRPYDISSALLTLFVMLANVEARTFYKRINFENDEICPSNYEYEDDEEKPDYLILSRNIRARSSRSKKKKKKSVKS